MAFDRNGSAEVDGGRSEIRRINDARHFLSRVVGDGVGDDPALRMNDGR
jgi:hypothetical protein